MNRYQQACDWYWAIISWDIHEPVFVFENEHHRVLIDFNEDGTLFFVDLLENLTWFADVGQLQYWLR